jgi:hypothetical protein
MTPDHIAPAAAGGAPVPAIPVAVAVVAGIGAADGVPVLLLL